MIGIVLKASGIWFLLVITAIVNGLIRENYLVDLAGTKLALPLSGLLLSVLVLLITSLLVPIFGSQDRKTYWGIGLFWVVLTLLFEFIFGHFVFGKSWSEIMQVFNIKNGDLFIFVLFVTAAAPSISAKARGIL
jgi:hypothetical protein